MDSARGMLEWVFDGVAALGLVAIVVGGLAWRRHYPPDLDLWALSGAAMGLVLFIVGVAASRHYKHKRLLALINAPQSRDHDAS